MQKKNCSSEIPENTENEIKLKWDISRFQDFIKQAQTHTWGKYTIFNMKYK